MSQVHEPTNEQLYENYPGGYQPSQAVARRDDHTLDARLDRIEDALSSRATKQPGGPASGQALALAIISLLMGVPMTAIALNATESSFGGLIMLIVVWLGIVGVNVAFTFGRRRA
ncbi:MAG TPA: hypothetical protein PKM36_11875 [Propionibacteriaceae bacterium]|jgi:small-conductance mechanosensitive channel|nr:hypothetical protein [Propionibacteriaceae bacterium]HPZ49721.1 hypothetical protein [Propionibacteriaceae bacterium]